MDKTFKLYFDEAAHKYTDIYNNPYTSVTTLIGKYKEKFDSYNLAKACAAIGRDPSHPKYVKYKGKTAKRLLVEWNTLKEEACEKGNIRHNYFENAIKEANGYRAVETSYINGRIYTVPEIVENPTYGALDLDYFEKCGVKKHYPLIYEVLEGLTYKGYLIYSEVGVFDLVNLISGLIDVFAYRPDDKTFIIVDWKTNNAPIVFESGYFEKDEFGNITNNFISTDKKFKYPISYLQESKGSEYGLQLSTYALLASKFHIKHKGNILFHITHNVDKNGLAVVSPHTLPDYTNEAKAIIEHHTMTNKRKNNQGKLFTNLKPIY